MHIDLYMFIYVYIHICIYTYVCVYIYTHMYTHRINSCLSRPPSQQLQWSGPPTLIRLGPKPESLNDKTAECRVWGLGFQGLEV